MSELASMTKAELLEEVRRLQKQYEECSESIEGNGKFDEDALFALVEGTDGDELFLVTDTGRFVYVNDAMLQSLGYEECEILGMSLPRIDPNNTRAAWLGRVSRLKQTDEADVFETEHICHDGSLQAKEITAVYVTYRSRNYILCIGKGIDRVEGKRSPASAVRTREQVLLQATSDGVLVVDTRGSIIESNAVADRLLGVTKNEMIGRSCVDSRWRLVDNDGSPLGIASHPLMIALVEEQPVSNRRISMLAPDGSRRMMMVNAAPVYDEAGSLVGAIGCVRPYEDSIERNEQARRDTTLNAMYRDVVHAIVEAGSEDDLERHFCETLVRHGDYPLVWRGITKSNDERIHPTVSAGSSTDYLMKIKIRYDNSEYGNGPIGRALKTQQVVVVSDLSTDPTYEPWYRQAERMGLHALAAFPLQYADDQVGILTCYSQEKNHFIGPELERLKEAAQLFSYGIGIRRRMEAERLLRSEYSAQRMMLDVYNSFLPIAVARFDTRDPFRCESANAHFSALVDEPFRSTGVEGCYVSDFMYASYHRDIYQRMVQAASGTDAIGSEDDVFTDWQGKEMRWSWRIVPVPGEAGAEQLLYIALRTDAGTTQQEVRADIPPREIALSVESSAGGPAVIRLSVPRFGARAKAETRLARFMDEGVVEEANQAACMLFSVKGKAEGRAPDEFFSEAMTATLGEILMLKGSGETVRFSAPSDGREIVCRVYLIQDEETQQLLLLCD
ncbi:MAG: PAS domain-containing protein [Bacteroidota bacterium]|jgi:PAS domain S-box-containing protein